MFSVIMLDFDEHLNKKEHKIVFLYVLLCHKVEESLENWLFSVFLRELTLGICLSQKFRGN